MTKSQRDKLEADLAKLPNKIGCDDVKNCGWRFPAATPPIVNPIGETCPKCGVGKLISDPGPSVPAQVIAERREHDRTEKALQRRALSRG